MDARVVYSCIDSKLQALCACAAAAAAADYVDYCSDIWVIFQSILWLFLGSVADISSFSLYFAPQMSLLNNYKVLTKIPYIFSTFLG